MLYYKVEKQGSRIFLVEPEYDRRYALKTEAVFAQCNGYMGVRACFDSKTIEENRGMFLAGLYHRANPHDVKELVNCPDITNMTLNLNGETIYLDESHICSFSRKLDIKTGELHIFSELKTKGGQKLCIRTRRFASMYNRSLYCHQVEIEVQKGAGLLCITTGIDGQRTNSGQSHFSANELRVFDKRFLHSINSIDSTLHLAITAACRTGQDAVKTDFTLKRRSVYGNYLYQVEEGNTIRFEKYSYITRNIDRSLAQETLQQCLQDGYIRLLKQHENEFQKFWKYADIQIEGASPEEEAAVSFAIYHMIGMTPYFTNQYSIGAKGLTGEGYKGHVFWDCEIFILPMFQYLFPEIAVKMLEFRYHGLPGARQKAREYGYQGAMFPWEVAEEGVEETPLYAALNIHSGEATKVWSGIKEHHVTADIAYAVWNYYLVTRDEEFMKQYGCQILLEAADFWCSRAKWDEKHGRFEILDIIGPDEYTEHIDNNAYTNYMAKYCVEKTLILLKDGQFVKDDVRQAQYQKFVDGIYLPQPNEDDIIPQDDTFLQKKELEGIEKYKTSDVKQEILLDYSRDEIIDMQVLKQADVVMLMNLCPEYFTDQVIKKNVKYYEARTIHDSSLSLCAHAIACANIGEVEDAYRFFQKAMIIDLDENPNSSADGIHAASLGGIWNCLIQGFAGLKLKEGKLSLMPQLPAGWAKMTFWLCMAGEYVKVVMESNSIQLLPEKTLKKCVDIYLFGELHSFREAYFCKYEK